MTTPTVAEVVAYLCAMDMYFGRLEEWPVTSKRIGDAAYLLESEHAARVEAERERAELEEAYTLTSEALNQTHEALMEWEGHACGGDCLAEPCSNCDGKGRRAGKGQKMAEQIEELTERAEQAERELATLRNRPCPYVHSSREGTHYCALPHVAEKELAELRGRIAASPRRVVISDGQYDYIGANGLGLLGQRVAIVPLRDNE